MWSWSLPACLLVANATVQRGVSWGDGTAKRDIGAFQIVSIDSHYLESSDSTGQRNVGGCDSCVSTAQQSGDGLSAVGRQTDWGKQAGVGSAEARRFAVGESVGGAWLGRRIAGSEFVPFTFR